MKPTGFTATLLYNVFQWLRDYPQCLLVAYLLRLLPIISVGKWVLATRFDEVREVLGRDSDFEVPFGKKMAELNGGPNFLLGMQDGEEYRRCQQLVMAAFRREDVSRIVVPMAARYAQQAIATAVGGRLDAVRDLITHVAARICEDYYGVPIEDKVEFSAWTFAMSGFLFGPPVEDAASHRIASEAGHRVRPVVDCAISNAKAGSVKPDTVLDRLIGMQHTNPDLTDVVIRSFLIGMITGFVPTSTIATGNMLEMLLRKDEFRARARAAALAGDDDLLKRCLFEAMRFKPLNPGPFRVCADDTVIAAGTPREKKILRDQILLASTQSAMLDERSVKDPRRFDPGRPARDYMLFGYGLHWCVGALIAEAHATQTLKALLLRPGLDRVSGKRGQLQVVDVFPLHLEVTL
jgi:cytochrome P450